MIDATSNTFLSGLLRLHYVEWGDKDAPPIILLHGLRAYAHWFDEFARTAAASHYRLIALDQRRPRPVRLGGRRPLQHRHLCRRPLRHCGSILDSDRMSLMGNSMGGINV